MKTCFKCNDEKPLTDFYKHKAMGDGHLNKCIPCVKGAVMTYRAKNIEHCREYDRNRPNAEARIKLNYLRYQQNKNDPLFKIKKTEYGKRYKADHPLRRSAHVQWGNFLRSNPWMKADKCSLCESDYKLEAHHEDYTKPLSVKWLCKNCHGARHKEINDEIRNGVDWSQRGF